MHAGLRAPLRPRPDQAAEAPPIRRHVPVTGRAQPGEGACKRAQRAPSGQQPQQRRQRRAGRANAAAGSHQMPGGQHPLLVHTAQQPLRLGVLERERPQAPSPVPREQLCQRPDAEAAVGVVEERRAIHGPRLEHALRPSIERSKLGAMDDAALFARMHASLRAFYGVVAAGASDSHLVEREGLIAAVVPATPDRSVCNGVVYDHPRTLASAIEELEHAYRRAGVRAWTVWVPPHDRESAALLEERGHGLDAAPAAMAFELAGFDGVLNSAIEIDPDPDVADIGRLNDLAYGYDGDLERALAGLEPGTAQLYAARQGDHACGSAAAMDHDGDCCIAFVATVPEMRGRGLASELLTRALIDARERGCATTSLQATKMGKPLYLRLGYRDLGPIEMWERREP